jgi:hypothetical protein
MSSHRCKRSETYGLIRSGAFWVFIMCAILAASVYVLLISKGVILAPWQ